MIRKYYIWQIILVILVANSMVKSQDLQSGFDLLNSGQYTKAAIYFKDIIKNEPENKTANICLGRALGLGGQVEEATIIFKDLANHFPGDQEVSLNVAEAYLWSKKPKRAEAIYEEMLTNDPLDIKSLIGMANAKAAQEDYQMARVHILKALSLTEDAYVLDLFQEISLALAYDLKIKNSYSKGVEILKEALRKRSNDRIFFSLADLYVAKDKPKKALKYLNKILDQNREHLTLKAYCYLLLQKPKRVLSTLNVLQEECTELGKNATKMKVEALLTLQRTEEAKALVTHMTQSCDQDIDVHLLMLRCQRQEDPGIPLALDSAIQLTEVEQAKLFVLDKKYHSALKTINREEARKTATTGNIYEGIYRQTSDLLSGGTNFTTDIAGNTSTIQSASFSKRWNDQHESGLSTQFRSVSSQLSSEGQISSFGVRHIYRHDHRHEFNMILGVQRANFEAPSNLWSFGIGHHFKANENHHFSLSANRQAQAYTLEMAQANLTTTGAKLTYHFSRFHYPGLYFQTSYDHWSNDNTQWNTFVSLYTFITRRPILKMGVNVSAMGFGNNMEQLYFSPSIYTSGEAFIQLEKNDPNKNWFYFLEGACGMQKIEDQAAQSTVRVRTHIGYRITNALSLRVEGFYNTSATTSIAGFTQQGGSINLSVLL